MCMSFGSLSVLNSCVLYFTTLGFACSPCRCNWLEFNLKIAITLTIVHTRTYWNEHKCTFILTYVQCINLKKSILISNYPKCPELVVGLKIYKSFPICHAFLLLWSSWDFFNFLSVLVPHLRPLFMSNFNSTETFLILRASTAFELLLNAPKYAMTFSNILLFHSLINSAHCLLTCLQAWLLTSIY